jgi:hypothetical protein
MIKDASERLKSSVWIEHELKAYQWFLVAMSGIKEMLIKDFVIISTIRQKINGVNLK